MRKQPNSFQKQSSSWENVGNWYHGIVGEEGHYYHQNIIMPGLIKFIKLTPFENPSMLDLACGQGILARYIPEHYQYVGVDLSPTLIKAAKSTDKSAKHEYIVTDVTKPLPIKRKDFSHAAVVLALQNIEFPDQLFKNASSHLRQGGRFMIVINHPCFRIPRQSSWKIDEEKKIQYRRIDKYYNPMQIPIQAHPSKGEQSVSTLSFHFPLSSYSKWLYEAGFRIELIEEWCSNKVSTGAAAKMENRSREEFPLFMAISAVKI